jgi:hypothetical protein
MNPGGWIFMGASWLFILALVAFSLVRVLAAKEEGQEPPGPTAPR